MSKKPKTVDAPPINGACLCGAVRFQVSLPTLFCGHCHCSMCRRNHGAAFVTWFGVPRAQLEILHGSDQLVKYHSSGHGARSFCATCGSSLFCESTKRPDEIDIVLSCMEGSIDREPEAHVYFSDRVPWITVDDGLPRLGGASGFDPLTDS